jgi:hypothetical protein
VLVDHCTVACSTQPAYLHVNLQHARDIQCQLLIADVLDMLQGRGGEHAMDMTLVQPSQVS